MKIAVVTDSSSYVPAEKIEEYNIHVVPNPVIIDGKVYKEFVDITTAEFYEKMRASQTPPTTSQISMGEMQVVFDKLVAEGYDTAICIHLSSGISQFIPNLVNYAPTIKNIKVIPFDSKITCIGCGYQAMLAGKLAKEGKTVEEIMPKLEELRSTTNVLFAVDDLSHLVRTGRLSNRTAFVGNLFKIKPILTINADGQIIGFAKERTMKKAFNHICDDFQEAIDKFGLPMRCNVIHANNQELADQWLADFKVRFPDVTWEMSLIGPVIGVHTGEKAMGIIYGRDYMKM